MKKILAIGLLSISFAQAKFFMGVEGAYDMYSRSLSDAGQLNVIFGSNVFSDGIISNGYYVGHVGINLGTQHMFNDYIGLRWLLGVGYGQIRFKADEYVHSITPYLGTDALFNFINAANVKIGMYLGLSVGVDIFQKNSTTIYQIPILGRIGLSTEIVEHHRVDIGTAVPIVTFYNSFGVTPVSISLGYKFLF